MELRTTYPSPTDAEIGSREPHDAPTDSESITPSTFVPILRETPFTPILTGIAYLQDPGDTAARRLQFEDAQLFVAACMSDNGFEYLPDDYAPDPAEANPISVQDALYLPHLPPSRAETELHGYGVEDLAPAPSSDSEAHQSNVNYYESLSESARAEYDLVLYGFDGESQTTENWDRSCSGRAQAAHPVDSSGPHDELLERFETLLRGANRLRMSEVLEDPRTVALNEEWDTCMQDAGYNLALPEFDRDRPDPFYAMDLAIRTPQGGVAGEPVPDTPADEIPLDERALVGSPEERTIALADFDCRAAMNYESRLIEIQIELENEFLVQHRESLEQFLAAIAQGEPSAPTQSHKGSP